MHTVVLIALIVCACTALAWLITLAVREGRRQWRRRKALSYCRRDAEGNIYVMDPQKKTWHRLDALMAKRVSGEVPHVTPRQKKRGRRRMQQALGAR